MKLFFLIFSIILAISLLLTGLLYLLRRRFAKAQVDREYLHSSVFSLFTTLYAFFLGFAIVTLWSAYPLAWPFGFPRPCRTPAPFAAP
jgi:Ni/Fe-hydrogenase subunit HybB-like protein